MSVLLVAPSGDIGRAIVTRLIEQGDEVRVVTDRDEGSWRRLGAHVAVGDTADDDLIMRAGQHSRTIVLFGSDRTRIESALAGAATARIERAVFVLDDAQRLPEGAADRLSSYVVLQTGRSRRRPRIAAADLARAVDAADDLAGAIALRVDLREASAWKALGLEAPD